MDLLGNIFCELYQRRKVDNAPSTAAAPNKRVRSKQFIQLRPNSSLVPQ